MNKYIRKIVSWYVVIMAVMVVSAAARGGVVYAFQQSEPAQPPVVAESGVLVAGVLPDSPAALAGVKRGDIILQLDGQAVNFPLEMVNHIQSLAAGSQMQITLLHGDDQRTLTAILAEPNGQPFLGILPCGSGQPVLPLVEEFKPGARVMAVLPGSPAALAGLQPGDIISAVEGQNIGPDHNLAELIQSHAPGETIALTVERPGEAARQVMVTLTENPNQPGTAQLGVRFGPSEQDHLFIRPFNQMPVVPGRGIESGLIIHDVAENSPAAAAGLSQGEVITAIDGQPVRRPRDLVEAVAQRQPGSSLTLTITNPSNAPARDVTVTLGRNPAGAAYLGVRIGGFFSSHRFGDNQGITKEFYNFSGQPSFDFFEPFPAEPFEFEALPFEDEFQSCSDASQCFGDII